jgi:hypothetical protein
MKKVLFFALLLMEGAYCSSMSFTIENCTDSPVCCSANPFVYSMLMLIDGVVPEQTNENLKIELGPRQKKKVDIFVDSSVCGQKIKDETMKMKINGSKEVDLKWGLNYLAGHSPLVPYIEERENSVKSVLVFLTKTHEYLIKIVVD